MDTTDSPNANLPARLPAASSRLPAQVTVAPRELTPAAPPSLINSRLLFRGLAQLVAYSPHLAGSCGSTDLPDLSIC